MSDWLAEVAQRSEAGLAAMHPTNQPSWYRWVRGNEEVTSDY